MSADWTDAACVGENPELWFADERTGRAQQAEAVAICGTCPIRDACLEQVMAFEAGQSEAYRTGIYAGLTGAQRANLRPRARLLSPCGTASAHRRHLRRGEKSCAACVTADREYHAERKRRRAA